MTITPKIFAGPTIVVQKAAQPMASISWDLRGLDYLPGVPHFVEHAIFDLIDHIPQKLIMSGRTTDLMLGFQLEAPSASMVQATMDSIYNAVQTLAKEPIPDAIMRKINKEITTERRAIKPDQQYFVEAIQQLHDRLYTPRHIMPIGSYRRREPFTWEEIQPFAAKLRLQPVLIDLCGMDRPATRGESTTSIFPVGLYRSDVPKVERALDSIKEYDAKHNSTLVAVTTFVHPSTVNFGIVQHLSQFNKLPKQKRWLFHSGGDNSFTIYAQIPKAVDYMWIWKNMPVIDPVFIKRVPERLADPHHRYGMLRLAYLLDRMDLWWSWRAAKPKPAYICPRPIFGLNVMTFNDRNLHG